MAFRIIIDTREQGWFPDSFALALRAGRRCPCE